MSLSKADIAYVAPIFPSARENSNNFSINSAVLRKEAQHYNLSNVIVCNTNKEIIEKLSNKLHQKDIIITMGAGDIYKLKDDIIKLINKNDN